MTHQEYEELLNAYLDLEATAEEENVIREHMKTCAICRNLYEENKILKEKLRGLNETIPLPHDLNKVLETSLNNTERGKFIPHLSLGLAISIALGLILVLFIGVYLFKPAGPEPLIDAVVKSYRDISDGKLPIAYKATNAKVLEANLEKTGGIPFEFDVDDFSEAGFKLNGAVVADLAKRRSLIFMYEGKEPVGYYLMNSRKSDFPIDTNKIRNDEKATDFYTLQRDGYNVVVWKEEGNTCFMVSKLNSDELLSLAAESVED
jgi:anti-sigma factor RsiW